MQRRTWIITLSSLTAVVLVGAAIFTTGPGAAHGRWAAKYAHGPMGNHVAQRLCSEQRDERITKGIDFVEAFVSFTPEQTESWNALKTAVVGGSAKIGTACQTVETEGKPTQAPHYLARAELALTTALDIVTDVRPAFDDLYGKLNDEQRKRIDELLAKRGHHKR